MPNQSNTYINSEIAKLLIGSGPLEKLFYSVRELVFPVLLLIENKFQTELIYD